MKVKVIVAVATAVCLGALSVVVFTKTSVRVDATPPHVVNTSAPTGVDAEANKHLHDLLSGGTPPPKDRP